MKLALFDFDGTITTDDSLIKFIRYAVGNIKTLYGLTLLFPTLLLYKLKLIPNYIAKQSLLTFFFKGMNEKQFKELAKDYSLNHIKTILRPKAMDKIQWHKDRGHKIIVISASIECWIKPWCDEHKLDLVATRLEIKETMVTGKLMTKNCYGLEKVTRLREAYNLNEYDYIYAYGDSRGDKELMDLADEKFYKPFRD